MAATAVHPARTFESNPASFNGEDLLRETLVTPQDQSEQQERDYTDDLEDLVRSVYLRVLLSLSLKDSPRFLFRSTS